MTSVADTDKVFAGLVPEIYETYLVPLIFEPYAADLARRLRTRNPSRVLEVAAGTGVVTRELASALPESTSIVATDLNQAMLDQAEMLGTRAKASTFHDCDHVAQMVQFHVSPPRKFWSSGPYTSLVTTSCKSHLIAIPHQG